MEKEKEVQEIIKKIKLMRKAWEWQTLETYAGISRQVMMRILRNPPEKLQQKTKDAIQCAWDEYCAQGADV